MKVLLLGASGLLGRAVRAAFEAADWEVVAPTHAELDLLNFPVLTRRISALAPELIINCAAQRKPDLCEAATPDILALNVELPHLLAQSHRPLIHISTDYVFNGANAPYAPDAHCAPLNAYGLQKAQAESRLAPFEQALIVRVPILFGPTDDLRKSAVTVLAANLIAARGACVTFDDTAIRYPTYTCDIARQLFALAAPLLAGKLHGIVHYSAEEPMTKCQMAMNMAPLVGCSIDQCLPDYTPPRVPRPYDCHLSTRALRQRGIFVEPTSFAAAIIQTLAAFH